MMHTESMKDILRFISQIFLIFAGLFIVTGTLNTLFGWSLEFKVHNSRSPLPENWSDTISSTTAMLLFSGLFLLLADMKRVLQFLNRHRRPVFVLLGVGVAIAAISLQRFLPILFLEFAVQGGDSEKAQAMLERRDYPVDVLEHLTYSALDNGDYEVARMMFEQGADVNHRRGEFDLTLLHSAVLFFAPEATDFLIDQGIEVNAQDSLGQTALYVLISSRAEHTNADEAEILAMAESLLAAGADPNLPSERGETAITVAERDGNESLVQLLQGV